MSADTVPSHVFCPSGHGEEWLMKWDGSRADYLCSRCQQFFDVDAFDRPIGPFRVADGRNTPCNNHA